MIDRATVLDQATQQLIEHLLSSPPLLDRLIQAINARQRGRALRVREELIHQLRAYEEMYGLPQAIPPKREREEHDHADSADGDHRPSPAGPRAR